MKQRKARWRVMLMLIPVLAFNHGCTVSPGEADSPSTVTHSLPIMIKVDQAAGESVLRARLPVLAATCEVQLSYVRPMSGGAHVVQMRAPMPEAALHCLRAQPDVLYVQEDKLVRPASGGSQ